MSEMISRMSKVLQKMTGADSNDKRIDQRSLQKNLYNE